MIEWLPTLFARINARIWTKLSVSLFCLVALFFALGAVGLDALSRADQKTKTLIDLQRRVAAYQALQSNTTALRFIVANAFLESEKRDLDSAARQISQIAYDFNRAEFVAAADRDKIKSIEADYDELVEIGSGVIQKIRAGQLNEARAGQTREATRLGDRIERLTLALITNAEAEMLQQGADVSRSYVFSRYLLTATALIGVLAALIVGFAFSRSLVSPLRRVNQRLRQISAGEFSGALQVVNRDELGELTDNVNRMSGELETLYDKLEQASQHKTDFLATMSHEIRTPMNAIMGMAELMLDTPLTREQRDYAQTSRDSGQSLLTIIDDILDFSKIEAGELELEKAPFNLRHCVESALDMIAHVAGGKDLDLAYRIEDGVPEEVIGDITRLRQILVNLLNNAVKFTEQGEVAVHVAFDATAGKGRGSNGVFKFRVQDTGIGIPADRIDRLFQSFKQVDASTKRKYGGTGLGLAICKRLAEAMGGNIGVESKPAVGTTFHFEVLLGWESGEEAPADIRLKGRRVLALCPGDTTNCEELGRCLTAWGILPDVASHANLGLQKLSDERAYDAVIIDFDQYQSDRTSLDALLSASGSTPSIAVVRRGRQDQRPKGFDGFVQKPIKPSQLYDSLIERLYESTSGESVRKIEASPFDAEMGTRSPLRILLADDHPTNKKLALLVLGRIGYQADTVSNGSEVLTALENKTYDLILMDIHMPEMDGLEATREVRNRYPGNWPRIVMMTANVLQKDWEACKAAGAVDIVRKPIDIAKLTSTLAETSRLLVEDVTQPPDIIVDRRNQQANGKTTSSLPHADDDEITPDNLRLDRSAIDRLVDLVGGDPSLFGELVQSFRSEAPRLFADLEAGAEGDPERLRVAAHTIKTSAADFGAGRLSELCIELERLGAAKETAGIVEMVSEAIEEWQTVEQELISLSNAMATGEQGTAREDQT